MAEPPPRRAYLHPHTLTILGTYRCTARCSNCCFDSGPSLTQRVSYEDIAAFITEAAQHDSVRLVVFSGGECFLLKEDLVRAVELATSKGLLTRCVTNGYWAKNLAHGRRRLRQLVDAGLGELNISTGDAHQQWVSQDTVVNAACLGVELGLANTLVVVEAQARRSVTASALAAEPRIRELAAAAPSAFRIIESAWMPMSADAVIEQAESRMLTRENVHLRGGCTSVLSTIVLTPSRDVGLCCGLSRERIPELNSPWNDDLTAVLTEAGRDFMKIWLFVDGPERILAWAASKDGRIDWEHRYSHHCHACLALFDVAEVRQAIQEHYRERVDDVLMRYSLLLRQQEALSAARHAEDDAHARV